ncbi:MAG: LL-diaminopimelate aminotransferase [Candidatus Caldatribacteriota bacterium]
MKIAQRIQNIPPYLFAEIDKKKEEAIKRGVQIINLGIGDPDQPTPSHIIEKLQESVKDPKMHNYPPYEGTAEFRQAIVSWYKNRFGIVLDPEKEVIALIGSKEGIAHIFLAFIDPGDFTLLPDPGYPVYKTGTLFANGIPYMMPLLKENSFLPDLEEIDEEIAQQAKLMFINYPNNPTAAVADKDFFKEVVSFAKKYDILVCHDFAYSETTFDNYQAPSFLEVEGGKEVGIEFHSLSKLYNMTGWRIGFAVGKKEAISALSIVKSNIDSGVFKAIQKAGVEALTGPQDNIEKMNKIYSSRRNLLISGLNKLGWNLEPTKGTFYVWVPVINKMSSVEFANLLLDKCGIIVTPGIGYGEYGEGYVRIALTVEEKRIAEAIERLKNLKF